MALEQATTGQIIKYFTNSLLYKLAKFSHRRNIDVDDENYENIVIRSGWTYEWGHDYSALIVIRNYGIEYDEAPLVFVSSGFMRPISEGAPTKLEDMYLHVLNVQTEKVISIYKTIFEASITTLDGETFSALYYFGAVWLAIGKKT